MLSVEYDYRTCIQNSEKVAWRISDILHEGAKLDFSRKFLPEALSGAESLSFLSPKEKLALNHIRGNSYLYLFRFVEEYIIAMVVQHIDAEIFGDEYSLRALLRFAEEEVKHQQLFKKFGEIFERDFGTPCGVAGSPEEVAGFIMQKSPMAVVLMTLHIELFTQHHYTASVRDNDSEGLDPLFKSMLKHHWLEESQHAKLDALELAKLANDSTQDSCDRAVNDYMDILKAFDGLLLGQVELDIESLKSSTGRSLNAAEREEFIKHQHRSYRYVFLVLGMTNPIFMKHLADFSPTGAQKVAAMVSTFS